MVDRYMQLNNLVSYRCKCGFTCRLKITYLNHIKNCPVGNYKRKKPKKKYYYGKEMKGGKR